MADDKDARGTEAPDGWTGDREAEATDRAADDLRAGPVRKPESGVPGAPAPGEDPPDPPDGTATRTIVAGETRTVSLTAPADRTVDLESQTSRVGIDGTFLQRSGVKLFGWVLGATAVALFLLFANLVAELLRVAPAPSGNVLTRAFQSGDTVQTLRLATHYRAVAEVGIAQRDSAWSHFILGVKEVIVTVFLPLLTGILGYIFGTRSESVTVDGASNADE